MPRPVGDLYIALAGGRDVMEGKLAQPDDWAFTTNGRVWLNQNWGAGLIFYLTHLAAGEVGLLLLKAALLVAIVILVALTARHRGVGWPVALLAAGAAIAVAPTSLVLRPNLFTLMLAPLLLILLYRTRKNIHWVWAAVVTIAIWANLHGGFMFALGVLGLWTLCHVVAVAIGEGLRQMLRRCWPLIAGTVAATALAGLANPYGPENLTHALSFTRHSIWQDIKEWQPFFSAMTAPLPSSVQVAHFLLIGVLAGLTCLRVLALLLKKRTIFKGRPAKEIGAVAFDVCLVAVVIVMSFRSRRFITLAAVMLGPFLAIQLQWFLQSKRRGLPAAVVSIAVLVAITSYYCPRLAWIYDRNNPFRPSETLFERMILYHSSFPVGATKFLNANGASGRVFHDWRWEGFLRWHCRRLKLFLGGRAPQVYEEPTAWLRRQIASGMQSAAKLKELGVHLTIISMGPECEGLRKQLVVAPAGRWAYVYCDRWWAVLADAGWAKTKELIKSAAMGQLHYPDAATAALSQGMCLSSHPVKAQPRLALAALQGALDLRPTAFAYIRLVNVALAGDIPKSKIVDYLETESYRLELMDVDCAEGVEIIKCRAAVADLLAFLYDPLRDKSKRQQVLAVSGAAKKQINSLAKEAW